MTPEDWAMLAVAIGGLALLGWWIWWVFRKPRP